MLLVAHTIAPIGQHKTHSNHDKVWNRLSGRNPTKFLIDHLHTLPLSDRRRGLWPTEECHSLVPVSSGASWLKVFHIYEAVRFKPSLEEIGLESV